MYTIHIICMLKWIWCRRYTVLLGNTKKYQVICFIFLLCTNWRTLSCLGIVSGFFCLQNGENNSIEGNLHDDWWTLLCLLPMWKIHHITTVLCFRRTFFHFLATILVIYKIANKASCFRYENIYWIKFCVILQFFFF